MRKPTDDLIEPAHLVFAKQPAAYLARIWHEAQDWAGKLLVKQRARYCD
jgi:hypothetical protein